MKLINNEVMLRKGNSIASLNLRVFDNLPISNMISLDDNSIYLIMENADGQICS